MSLTNQITPFGSGEVGEQWDDLVAPSGRVRRLRGRLVPEPERLEHEPYPYGHEVELTPGRCVTWRCEELVPDWPNRRECDAHASEPVPSRVRDRTAEYEARKQREADDFEWAEKQRARRREASRRSRLDPAYRDKHNARKRAKRAAATGGAS